MFESSFKTKEQVDAQAAEGRSPDQIASLQLAAVLLVINVFLTIAVSLALDIERVPLLNMIVALVMAYYLYKLRSRAENLALGLSLLAAVVGPLLYFWQLAPSDAFLESVAVWGVAGALLLLLIGDPSRRRRVLAVVIFCIFRVGLYGVAVAGRLLS